MTCAKCGMTVGWDCDCDAEYNALVEEAALSERRHGATRPPAQWLVNLAHDEALQMHRGWLTANCGGDPQSDAYANAERALQIFDEAYPDIRGSR